MQLNRVLALCGMASRRKANQAIFQGRVVVNGDCVQKPGQLVDIEKDEILVDGQRLVCPQRYRYILLNKPKGVITTVTDDRKRKTVVDLVNAEERLFPVGRLDLDTEGVLLLTNDGDLTYRLSHPKYEIDKLYRAWVEGRMRRKALKLLARGVDIDEGVNVNCDARILETKSNQTQVEIRIHQGKKRQIKRMLKAVGHPVIYLERIQFGSLKADGLSRGEWRDLSDDEVTALYRIAGLEREVA